MVPRLQRKMYVVPKCASARAVVLFSSRRGREDAAEAVRLEGRNLEEKRRPPQLITANYMYP